MYYSSGEKDIQRMMPTTVSYFKEVVVNEKIFLPNEKPNIQKILSFTISPEIENVNLIKTEIGVSNEGQNLTGYKLIIELNLKEKITYVADDFYESIHLLHHNMMKSTFVIVPIEYDGQDVCSLFRTDRIEVTPYIEAEKTKKLDCRTIYSSILFLVDVKIC